MNLQHFETQGQDTSRHPFFYSRVTLVPPKLRELGADPPPNFYKLTQNPETSPLESPIGLFFTSDHYWELSSKILSLAFATVGMSLSDWPQVSTYF